MEQGLSRVARRRVVALLALAGPWLAVPASGAESAIPVPNPALNAYLDDSHRTRLPDGRTINLVCMGQGSPAVVLLAGLGDWSGVWGLVQPAISARTRACAWDRAGFGFSGPSGEPQTTMNTAADLRAALRAAGIAGPFVLVGHSYGGLEMLAFIDRHRDEVAGAVFVDPSTPRQIERFARALGAAASTLERMRDERAQFLRRCATLARDGAIAAGSQPSDSCLGLNPVFPPGLTTALARAGADPARYATQVSLLENVPASTAQSGDDRRDYGELPLVVLTAAEQDPPPPGVDLTAAHLDALAAASLQGKAELARLSSRGKHRVVPATTHYIQFLKPEVVVEAVGEVLDLAAGTH